MIASDQGNDIFELAFRFVNETDRNIFLTGKAGTGKTTFLKTIREKTGKKMIVVAPTGIAAINAVGVTIHSFFQLPFGLHLPDPFRSGLSKMQWGASKVEIMRCLELLVIDEISMVRADLLDAVDQVLRFVRKRPDAPFGGVQTLFIGDLFQLSPIAKNEEWEILKDLYSSPFFFDAHVTAHIDILTIELTRIYRQQDDRFIQLLNNVRNNCCTAVDFAWLNSRLMAAPKADDGPSITLTSHNQQADTINQQELDKLPGQLHCFEAKITSDFPEKSYPAPKTLVLKEKAQVIFIKNDSKPERRYYNGKLAIIDSIDNSRVFAHFSDGEKIQIEPEAWTNTGYVYDKDSEGIADEALGSFRQLPVKPAWAITIHKSQGLSFERAVIDAADSFAPGQVYVALSRLTHFEGLTLRSAITASAISTDARVLSFLKTVPPATALPGIDAEKQKVVCRLLKEKFSFGSLAAVAEAHATTYGDSETKLQLRDLIKKLVQYSATFCGQLDLLFPHAEADTFTSLGQRVKAAVSFFTKELEDKIVLPVQTLLSAIPAAARKNQYAESLNHLLPVVSFQKEQFDRADKIVQVLAAGKSVDEILLLTVGTKPGLTTAVTKAKTAKTSATQTQSLELLRKGLSVEQIAAKRHLSIAAVEQHLIGFIASGELAIQDLVAPEKLKPLTVHLASNPGQSPAAVRQAMGKQFSFSEIRAFMAYIQSGQAGEMPTPGPGGNLFAL